MSVAAKAGEMQIFSQDIYGQNGVSKHRKKVSAINISLTTGNERNTR